MPLEIIPLQTKIITPEDRMLEIVATYAGPYLRPGDTLVLAESVVAITQGRLIRPEQVKPRPLGTGPGPFRQPGRQPLIPLRHAGDHERERHPAHPVRLLRAAVTRLVFGRRGDFYRLAGEQASLVDDITGNMPPFDKHIVLGPNHPEQVVAEIKKHFGAEAAIIDANDLGRTKILAATSGVSQKLLLKVFRANPAGNADQQTPIVIVRSQPVARS